MKNKVYHRITEERALVHEKHIFMENGEEKTVETISTYVLPSSCDDVSVKLDYMISTNLEDLSLFLARDFIYPSEQTEKISSEEEIDGNLVTIERTYLIYKKGTYHYELVRNRWDLFNRVLGLIGNKPELFKKMYDFSGMDLSQFDFKKIPECHYPFLNLSNCSLAGNETITSQILAAAAAFRGATLPKRLLPVWSIKQKNEILSALDELWYYGNKLLKSIDKEGNEKGKLAQELVLQLRKKIASAKWLNTDLQKEVIACIKTAEPQFAHKRYWKAKMLLSNALLLCLGCVVGYLMIGYIRSKQGHSFFVCNETHSQQLLNETLRRAMCVNQQ